MNRAFGLALALCCGLLGVGMPANGLAEGDAPKQPEADKEPTLEETNAWLIKSLPKLAPTGKIYIEDGCYGKGLHRYELLAAHPVGQPCQFAVKEITKRGGKDRCVMHRSYEFRWRDLDYVGAHDGWDMTNADDENFQPNSVTLMTRDNSKLIDLEIATDEEGGESTSKVSSFKIYVDTKAAGARIAKAFKRAIKLCSEQDPPEKEPF